MADFILENCGDRVRRSLERNIGGWLLWFVQVLEPGLVGVTVHMSSSSAGVLLDQAAEATPFDPAPSTLQGRRYPGVVILDLGSHSSEEMTWRKRDIEVYFLFLSGCDQGGGPPPGGLGRGCAHRRSTRTGERQERVVSPCGERGFPAFSFLLQRRMGE